MRILSLRSWLMTLVAEASLVLGRVAEAHERAQGAVALARTHKERGWEAWGLRVLGDVHAHPVAEIDRHQGGHAADAYRQALALATELSMRPLVAHCRFALGKLYARTGECEEATQHLKTATRLYREMDMRFWLEKAEAVLNEVSAR